MKNLIAATIAIVLAFVAFLAVDAIWFNGEFLN